MPQPPRDQGFTRAIFREKLKECCVSEIFFEISALAQILRINFRHRQTVPAKMAGKFEESDVFFAHVVQNANRAVFSLRQSRIIFRPEPPSWPWSG